MYRSGRQNVYEVNQISTASKTKLIILMYDGAIRFVMEARRRLEMKDIPGRGLYICKAQHIINELSSAVNRERGGAVAIHLEKLYFEINMLLTHANIKGDPKLLDTTLNMLRTIREAWEQVINSPTGKAEGQQETSVTPQNKPKVAISC